MYDKMASVYDFFMADVPYEAWIELTVKFTETVHNRHVLDLGSGTGEMAYRLKPFFSTVTGIDLSEEMVKVAHEKYKAIEGLTFEQGHISNYAFDQKFGVIVSYLDVFNYLTDPTEVKRAFKLAHDHLDEGGVFIFDVHSLSYVNRLIDEEIFSTVTDEMSYIWFCEKGDSPGEVCHDLTFFVKENNTLYRRFDELHIQRSFPESDYRYWLTQAGFSQIEVYPDFDFHSENGQGERLFFVCQI